MKKSLENLIEFQPPTQAGTICAEILEKFSNDPDLLTIPIVSSERPVGLVTGTSSFRPWRISTVVRFTTVNPSKR